MKRKIRILVVLILLLLIHQYYWYNKMDGNVIVYVSNVSEDIDSYELDIYLDGEKVISDNFNGKFINFKRYSFKVSLGKHNLIIKNKNEQILENFDFHSNLVKRILVEYQGDNITDNSSEVMVSSEVVLSNFIIE